MRKLMVTVVMVILVLAALASVSSAQSNGGINPLKSRTVTTYENGSIVPF